MFARRALEMTEADFRERRRPITLYVVQGFRIVRGDETRATFEISITNGSVSPETITRVELRIFYKNHLGEIQSIVRTSDAIAMVPPTITGATTIKHPLNLQARTSIEGWASFKIPKLIIEEKVIEKYQICVISANGEMTYDVYVLNVIEMK
jgi:hypothetical protein